MERENELPPVPKATAPVKNVTKPVEVAPAPVVPVAPVVELKLPTLDLPEDAEALYKIRANNQLWRVKHAKVVQKLVASDSKDAAIAAFVKHYAREKLAPKDCRAELLKP